MNAQTAKDLPIVLIACLVYGVIGVAALICASYNWRIAQFIFMTLNFITFIMAFVALGRRKEK